MAEDEKIFELSRRYQAAMHGVQTGIATLIRVVARDGAEWSPATPKHLRAGVDSSMVQNGALVALLIRKGVFTELEWAEALCGQAEKERLAYEQEVAVWLGGDVKLG